MRIREFAVYLSLCLLLLVPLSSATKKPLTQPININTADSPATASPGHRPIDRRKNSANAQILRCLQKRQRPDGHPGYWPKTSRKNEEISNGRQVRSPKHPSTRQLPRMRKNKTPCTHKIRLYTESAPAAATGRAAGRRNRRTLGLIYRGRLPALDKIRVAGTYSRHTPVLSPRVDQPR